MYEIRRTGRKDKDNTWEPLNFLQNMAPYVMKMVKRFDEVMKAQEGGAAIRPLTTPEIRKHLADFQLDGQLADSRIKGFSGGQKSRLVLAAALWNRPHILALDEPTNYLDQEALGALARSITSFQGGVLMVSHNKEFVSQVRDYGGCPAGPRPSVGGSERAAFIGRGFESWCSTVPRRSSSSNVALVLHLLELPPEHQTAE